MRTQLLVFNVLVVVACSCGGGLPDACEDAGFGDRACTKALDEYCVSESDETACGEKSELQVGASTVKCVWGYTATIADADSCSMSPGGRCYATPVNDDGPPCEDFCEDTSSGRFLFLYDDVLVRLPCQSGVNNWLAPVFEESADGAPIGSACFAGDATPDSPLCECAAAACDILK